MSDDLQVKEKLAIIGDEYNIPINSDFREDVNIMCNLAEGIEERARKHATEEATKATINSIIINAYKQGRTLELISNVTGTSVDKVETVIKKESLSMA